MGSLTAPGTAWLNEAEDRVMAWPDSTLVAVLDRFPYPPGRHVRRQDWAMLVAHVSHRRGEDIFLCADRLASYVKASGERHGHQPSPDQVAASQEPQDD